MTGFGFTPAREQDIFNIEASDQPSSKSSSILCGHEARRFYEDLVKNDKRLNAMSGAPDGQEHQMRVKNRESRRRVRSRRVRASEVQQVQTDSLVERRTGGEREDNQRRENGSTVRTTELQGLRLLRCAHEGDLSGLKELLSKGVDINFQDTYFWTALMCGSWSGQRAVVRFLLQQGAAWVGVVDTQGRDAKDLAVEAGHSGVSEELDSYGRISPQQTERSTPQPQWCEVCSCEYSSCLSSHLSSTLHQFSLRRPPPTPYYCLPPSSNSYKMMVRCGWRPGTGLGPDGEGPRQPVPTILKRDQQGLGYGQMRKAKVTHFQARDHDAVKQPTKKTEEKGNKGTRKEESRRKEQKDKNWERDFRASFYL
ncbi:G patch domain and ankyrin repeat-containing protein 1 [Aulostomus maculatus]